MGTKTCPTAPVSSLGNPAASSPASTGSAVSIGRDITINTAGYIMGLRFWRLAGATPVARNLKLWTNAGVALGPTLTTAGEPTSPAQWVSALYAAPVAAAAGAVVQSGA